MALGTIIRVRIVGVLLLAGIIVACFGCASGRSSSAPAAWQDPDAGLPPLSMLATQGVPSRVVRQAAPGLDLSSVETQPVVSPNEKLAVAKPQSAGPVKGSFPTSLVSLREWCHSVRLNPPVPSIRPGSFAVRNATDTFLLTVGSQVARWRGMEVHLGYAPLLIEGQVYVQSADVRSTLHPLLLGTGQIPLAGPVIVLDPGHGGTDSGAKSAAGGSESAYALDWARRLQALLVADGWQVHLTRTANVEVALSNRVAFADSVGANLFLSLHFNSAAPDKSGVETYCLTPPGVPSTLTRGYIDERDLRLPNNHFDAQNVQLAVAIHHAMLQVNGGRDRGVRRARFLTVLRGQQRPAVLLEGGYLSNTAEARLIAQASHRQRLAEAVAGAIRTHAPWLCQTNSLKVPLTP